MRAISYFIYEKSQKDIKASETAVGFVRKWKTCNLSEMFSLPRVHLLSIKIFMIKNQRNTGRMHHNQESNVHVCTCRSKKKANSH